MPPLALAQAVSLHDRDQRFVGGTLGPLLRRWKIGEIEKPLAPRFVRFSLASTLKTSRALRVDASAIETFSRRAG
jgi:hypothetical protein